MGYVPLESYGYKWFLRIASIGILTHEFFGTGQTGHCKQASIGGNARNIVMCLDRTSTP